MEAIATRLEAIATSNRGRYSVTSPLLARSVYGIASDTPSWLAGLNGMGSNPPEHPVTAEPIAFD